MDDRVGEAWHREGDLVYVDQFGPCLPKVEFLPGRHVCDVCLRAFYSRDLATRSLRHIRRRFPDARLLVRRTPLDLGWAGDFDEYRRHVSAADQEARWTP